MLLKHLTCCSCGLSGVMHVVAAASLEELVREKLEQRAPDELLPEPDPYELRAPRSTGL